MSDLLPTTIPVPMPVDWSRIHGLLAKARRDSGLEAIPEPPIPLILSGASVSKPSWIRAQWIELLEWANQYGYADLVMKNLPPPPAVDVAEDLAGITEDGRQWWPEVGNQNHDPKERPSADQLRDLLTKLSESWEQVVGVELAAHTKAIAFTGRKRRHLVVAADPGVIPPWGDWSYIRINPQSFSAFRRAINDALAPFSVDHVSFDNGKWRR